MLNTEKIDTQSRYMYCISCYINKNKNLLRFARTIVLTVATFKI